MKKENMIRKRAKKASKKTGLPPGSIVYTGTQRLEKAKIKLIQYDENQLIERELFSVSELAEVRKNPLKVNWINIEGLHQVDLIEKVGELFELHSLTLEDISNIDQRPKFIDFKDHLFLTLKMLNYENNDNQIELEHFNFIVTDRFVITFQEIPGDVFDFLRERIRKSVGKIRQKNADYLFYALLDLIVDHYYIVIEAVGNKTEDIEDEIIMNSNAIMQQEIHFNKKSLLTMRKAITPLRDEIGRIYRSDSHLLDHSTIKYFGDVYDHSVHLVETIESFREINFGLMELYQSSIDNKMNQVIKVLTIISTIFIPLTFIVGLYGMNFPNIPEFRLTYGYFYVLGLMVAIVLFLIFIFKRKRWI